MLRKDEVRQRGPLSAALLSAMLLSKIVFFPFAARASDPESAFKAATGYTVRIRTVIETPFVGDEKGVMEGAGFLVDRERRWFLSNAHVVGRSPSRVESAFKGGEFFAARKVYVDPYLDMAVLEVPAEALPKNLVPAPLECNEMPPVGHPVGAFGHPWSLSYTGTRGIVSGVAVQEGTEWLQTDATLNVGNSGGPLISLVSGRVVGINAAMLDFANNLNFAVPMIYVCKILDLLREGRDPSPPELPFLFFSNQDGTEELKIAATYLNRESPPLHEGDVIKTIVDHPNTLENETLLIHVLRGKLEDAALTVVRDGKAITVSGSFRPVAPIAQREGLFIGGILLAPSGFRDEPETNLGKTLAIHYVEEGSLASARGLQEWDLIKSVDGQPYHDIQALSAHLKEAAGPVHIVVKRLSEASDRLYEYQEVDLPGDVWGIVREPTY